jgi:hypothetical protein
MRQSKRLAMHVRAPFRQPVALPHRRVARVNPARDAKQQREGEIGHRLVQHTGRVGHDDAVAGGGREVHRVKPHAPARHQLQLGQCREHRFIEHIQRRDHRLRFGQRGDQRIALERAGRAGVGERAAGVTELVNRLVAGVGKRGAGGNNAPAHEQ